MVNGTMVIESEGIPMLNLDNSGPLSKPKSVLGLISVLLWWRLLHAFTMRPTLGPMVSAFRAMFDSIRAFMVVYFVITAGFASVFYTWFYDVSPTLLSAELYVVSHDPHMFHINVCRTMRCITSRSVKRCFLSSPRV